MPPMPEPRSRWSESTKPALLSPSATSGTGDPNRVSAMSDEARLRGPRTEASLYSLYATRTNNERDSSMSWAVPPKAFRPGTLRTVDSEELEKWGLGTDRGRDEDLPPMTPATVFDRDRR